MAAPVGEETVGLSLEEQTRAARAPAQPFAPRRDTPDSECGRGRGNNRDVGRRPRRPRPRPDCPIPRRHSVGRADPEPRNHPAGRSLAQGARHARAADDARPGGDAAFERPPVAGRAPVPQEGEQQREGAARWFHQARSQPVEAPRETQGSAWAPPRTSPNIPVVNRTPLVVATVPWQIRPPQDSLTIFAKGTFDLVPDASLRLRAEAELPSGDVYAEGDPDTSLSYRIRLRRLQAQGRRHAHGRRDGSAGLGRGDPSELSFRRREESVRARPRGVRRPSLAALGSRPIGERSAETFERMPLVWERAFGGPEFALNPSGRGHRSGEDTDVSLALPNLELPAHLIRGAGDTPQPACLAPVPPLWKQRWSKLGTYDARWQKTRWPYFPEDFDWAFFQCAPPAQQLDYWSATSRSRSPACAPRRRTPWTG